jgi:cytochrome oxidase assembly protein ShyY1
MHEKQAMLAEAAKAQDHTRPQPLLLASDRRRAQAFDWSVGAGRLANVTVWLDNQQRNGRVGVRMYCVLLPEIGTQAVLVDAGWWPLNGTRVLPVFGCPARETQRVRGLLAPPPAEGLIHGAALARQAADKQDEKQDDTRWLAARMDLPAIAKALNLPTGLAPRVLRLDPTRQHDDAGAMLAPGERDLEILPNTLTPERHLGYAVQWFGLAITVLVIALVLTLRKKKHE